MTIIGSWAWKGLGDALFSPKASGIEAKINEVKQRFQKNPNTGHSDW